MVKELDVEHISLGVLDWELESLIPTRLKGFVNNFALSALVAFAINKKNRLGQRRIRHQNRHIITKYKFGVGVAQA